MPENLEEGYCSRISLQAGEPLYGTASLAGVYFLLEYNQPWEAKALEQSGIPAEVKERLAALAKTIPVSKTLLIKRSRPRGEPGVHFFIALAQETDSRLYSFVLPDYPSLLALDVEAIVRGDPGFQENLSGESLLLVCTNGRRDQCCARYGVPLYQSLKCMMGDAVWECSHVGGHRFAANLYHLPAGIMYGRLVEADAPALSTALQAGEVKLENLRGRTTYPPAAQAAEYYLRQQTGNLDLDAYRFRFAQETTPGGWQVQFEACEGGRVFDLTVEVERSASAVYESCALDKQTDLVRYSRIDE